MNDLGSPSIRAARQTPITTATLSLCVFVSLVILSGLSCVLGTFYDDEIFNIGRAKLSFPNLIERIRFINATDIHPPVSYVFNKLTFELFENWKAVQFFNGTLNAAAIAWFHFFIANKLTDHERLVLTFALATAVTSELWGTGLRWNAYFNPAFLVLYTVALSKTPSITTRAAILAAGTVFLFYTSYLTIVAAPVLWGTFIATSFRDFRPEIITRISLILLAAGIACLPQLFALMTVHLPRFGRTLMGSMSYLFAFPYSIAHSVATLTVGNAVFPIDVVPVLFLGSVPT